MAKRMAPVAWQNRIVGEALVDPQTLLVNPYNFRVHSDHQADALRGVLREVGWVQRLIVNERTGHLLDGHLRLALACDHREPTVPVLYVDLSPAQEALILATLDPIGALATTNAVELAALLEITQSGEAAVQQLLSELAAAQGIGTTPPMLDVSGALVTSAKADDLNAIYAFREDALFASDSNAYGIPDLRPDRLATTWPTATYGAGPVTTPHAETLFLYNASKIPQDLTGGFLGFFVDDWRFEVVWRQAVESVARFRAVPWTAILAPDFSLWHHTPVAVQLFNVFRRQWCARYWQEAGFCVLPLINAMGGLGARSVEYACLGMPTRAPVLAVQCRTGTNYGAGKKEFAQTLGQTLETLAPDTCLLYGGEEHLSWLTPVLPGGIAYVPLASYTTVRRAQRARKVRHA